MRSSPNGERRAGYGKLADVGDIAAEGFIDVHLISAFGPHLSNVASQGAEVQQAGIPLGVAGYLVFSGIAAIMCGRYMRQREAKNCHDVSFYKEGSLLHDISQEIQTGNGATYSTRSSDQRGGVESIHLGIVPAGGDEHAACIIMKAPSRGESLYISSFPPSMKNPVIDGNTTRSTDSSFPALDPREYWRRGEPPPINCIQVESAWMNMYFNEYQRNFKTLHTPPGMTVHQYAVEILRKANAYRTMCPNSERERKQGLVCYSKQLLSTILEWAGGLTARIDMSEFRKELEVATLGLPNPESESKVIPGLGEPFPSPWQTQDPEPKRNRPDPGRGLW